MHKNDLPTSWPILAIDFDGVLHSYISGWKGPRTITDAPIAGAIEWLKSLIPDQDDAFAPRHYYFDVQIFSSRARHFGGRAAMRRWLLRHGLTRGELESIRFPRLKPPSILLIDDRALRFDGTFPTVEQMRDFRPYRVGTMQPAPPTRATGIDFLAPKDGPIVEGLEAIEVVYARNQSEYNPLRSLISTDGTGRAVSRWTLTAEQRVAIAQGNDIFLELMTFHQPLQPIRIFLAGDTNEDRESLLSLLEG